MFGRNKLYFINKRSNMRQVFVKEFDYHNLPDLLREVADWLEKENPKVWHLAFESYDNADYEAVQWAGYCFCFPATASIAVEK